MRRSPRLDKALLLLSDPARPGWVVADAWAVRCGRVAFRTQGGQYPNPAETCEIAQLAELLGQTVEEVVRELRACSKSEPDLDLQARLQIAKRERKRIQELQRFFQEHTRSPRAAR